MNTVLNTQLKKDIIEWDVPNWSHLIKLWQPVLDAFPRDSKVLAIGERNGGLSLWMALQGFQVVCTDRQGPTQQARELHKKYQVEDKITYYDFDLVNTQDFSTTYDIIIMKSVLGGLKEQYRDANSRTDLVRQKAVDNIYKLLSPQGIFLSADNLQGSIFLRLIKRLKNKQSGWHYFSIQELNDLCKQFSSVTVKGFGIIPSKFSIPILNKAAYIINLSLWQLLPPNSAYIAFTIAHKSF